MDKGLLYFIMCFKDIKCDEKGISWIQWIAEMAQVPGMG